jgi:RNA polymerase sigma factor (sigma-70 family)
VPGPSSTERAIHAAFRLEAPKLIAVLTRIVRDVGRAEELAQDALVSALEQWPLSGIPDNPGAWLTATAKHRAFNHLRRVKLGERKLSELGHALESATTREPELLLDDDIGDELLRLVFTACHPLLPTEARVALTLRLLGGLTTDEIARAFLVSEKAVAQRIVRAKRTLAEAGLPFEVPPAAERGARLASVLEVIYLIFNEGYAATRGDDIVRPALCDDALRLGRVLAGLMPEEAEVLGLVALMELNASRTAARIDSNGEAVLLLEQNRARWDPLLIRRGLAALEQAQRLAETRGPYTLQAALAACHARALHAADTDWPQIVALYRELLERAPSPIVELNRAMAVAMAEGPARGLALVEELAARRELGGYHWLPSARADLLSKLGRHGEAAEAFEAAAALTQNERQKTRLLERAGASRLRGAG